MRKFSVLTILGFMAVLALASHATADQPSAVDKVLSNPAQASMDDLARAAKELRRQEIEKNNDFRNAGGVAPASPDTAGLVTTAHVRQGDVAVSLIAEQPKLAPAPGGMGPESQTLASYKLSYQASLTDNLGNALPGPAVNLTFRIYSALVGGVLVEGPINVAGVAIDNGLVSTQIPVSLSTFDGSDRYITVAANLGAEMLPRYQVTAVAYALFAQRIASNQVLGSATDSGSLMIQNGAMAQPSITLDGPASQISTFGGDGLEQIRLWGPSWAELIMNDSVGNNTTVFLSAQPDSGGLMQLRDASGATRLQLNGQSTGTGGELSLFDDDGTETVEILGAQSATEGANMYLRNAAGTNTIQLDADSGDAALMSLRNTAGSNRIVLDGDSSGAGLVTLYQNDGSSGISLDGDAGVNLGGLITVNDSVSSPRVTLDGESVGTGGEVSVADDNGTETVEIVGAEDATTGGQVAIRNAAGVNMITMDGEFGAAGDDARVDVTGRVVCKVLQITGGADLSEGFDTIGETIQPGMVACLDPHGSGKLVLSRSAYDPKVVGIVAGAGGIKPGMLMSQKKEKENEPSIVDGELPVALIGRVKCYVDATMAAVNPGDMLTTSDTPGYAMKVMDQDRARDAKIGKAMTSLKKGEKGLVLVLVNLQ